MAHMVHEISRNFDSLKSPFLSTTIYIYVL